MIKCGEVICCFSFHFPTNDWGKYNTSFFSYILRSKTIKNKKNWCSSMHRHCNFFFETNIVILRNHHILFEYICVKFDMISVSSSFIRYIYRERDQQFLYLHQTVSNSACVNWKTFLSRLNIAGPKPG